MSRPEEWVDTKGKQRVVDDGPMGHRFREADLIVLNARAKQHVPEFRHSGSVTNPADAVDFYTFITEYYNKLRDETEIDAIILRMCRDAALRLMAKYRTVDFHGKKFANLSKQLRNCANNSIIDAEYEDDDK
jgi:hypothetical protein